jgi:hypothetical protein
MTATIHYSFISIVSVIRMNASHEPEKFCFFEDFLSHLFEKSFLRGILTAYIIKQA